MLAKKMVNKIHEDEINDNEESEYGDDSRP